MSTRPVPTHIARKNPWIISCLDKYDLGWTSEASQNFCDGVSAMLWCLEYDELQNIFGCPPIDWLPPDMLSDVIRMIVEERYDYPCFLELKNWYFPDVLRAMGRLIKYG